MEQLLPRLKRFYFRTALPAVGIVILAAIITHLRGLESDIEKAFVPMVTLLIATFVTWIVTSIIMRRAISRCKESEEAERPAIFERAYRIRIIALSAIAVVSALVYSYTADTNSAYLSVIVSLIIGLTYPSKTFVGNAIDNAPQQ